MEELKPANKARGINYDPQGSGEGHDPLFADLAPGVAASGNLKFKFDVPGDHTKTGEHPTGLSGE